MRSIWFCQQNPPSFRLLWGIVVCLTIGLNSFGCQKIESNRVCIVSSLPRTGVSRQLSDEVVRGIRLAIDEVKAKAGRFTLEYRDLDNSAAASGRWTSEGEAANARMAVQDSDVMAYIGTLNSGAARVSMPILNYADLLMVSPANTAVGLTKPGLGLPGEPNVYRPSGRLNYIRVVPADDLQGPLAADWAFERGVRRVFVIDDAGVYGRGVASLFADRCREQGMTVLDHVSIDPQAAEFKSFVGSVMSADPDLVYFGGSARTKGGQLARDLVSAESEAILLVSDGCRTEAFLEAAGAASLEGRCFATSAGLSPQQADCDEKLLFLRYRQKYGTCPSNAVIHGYEAARLVIRAIADVGQKDRRAIVESAFASQVDDGVLGQWGIDANGDTTLQEVSVSVVRDGKFVHEEVMSTAAIGKKDGSR